MNENERKETQILLQGIEIGLKIAQKLACDLNSHIENIVNDVKTQRTDIMENKDKIGFNKTDFENYNPYSLIRGYYSLLHMNKEVNDD